MRLFDPSAGGLTPWYTSIVIRNSADWGEVRDFFLRLFEDASLAIEGKDRSAVLLEKKPNYFGIKCLREVLAKKYVKAKGHFGEKNNKKTRLK